MTISKGLATIVLFVLTAFVAVAYAVGYYTGAKSKIGQAADATTAFTEEVHEDYTEARDLTIEKASELKQKTLEEYHEQREKVV